MFPSINAMKGDCTSSKNSSSLPNTNQNARQPLVTPQHDFPAVNSNPTLNTKVTMEQTIEQCLVS